MAFDTNHVLILTAYCEECNGQGEVEATCHYCAGSGEGHIPESSCRHCRGSGEVIVICEDCDGEGVNRDDE